MELKRIDRESPDRAALEQINEEAIPENERVPLAEMMATGAEVIGIREEGEPAGYLIIRIYRRICYLAFFAVRSDLRSRGTGGRALRELIRMYPDRQIVVEFEAPGEGAEADDIRYRRKQFYLRNGFFETGWYTYYDDMEFEIGCSDPAFDERAFGEFAAYLDTIVTDHIPQPYRKDGKEKGV